jgi:hypothetical protein
MNMPISHYFERQVLGTLRGISQRTLPGFETARWHTVMVSSDTYYLPKGVRAFRVVDGTAWIAYKLSNFTMKAGETLLVDAAPNCIAITSFNHETVVLEIAY